MTEQSTAKPTASRVFFGADGLRAGWGLLLFVVLIAVLGFAVNFLTSKAHKQSFGHAASRGQPAPETPSSHPATTPIQTPPARLLGAEGSSLFVVLLATFLMSRIERRPFPAYGLAGPRRLPQFLQGLLWGVACLSLLVAILRLTGLLHFDALLLHGASALKFALVWSLGFTLVAFLEETLLRGYLQYTLARGLSAIAGAISDTPHRQACGFWTAALLLSFLFGLGHGSNPGESPIGLLAAALAGLVFSLALYRTGSLWWAIGFHASWDWAQSFLYGVADSGTMVQYHLYATHPIGRPILSGGLTGPEGSLFVLPTLALVAAIILLTLPHARPSTS
jgi:membrane protease YdiL (CAAX protease family)